MHGDVGLWSLHEVRGVVEHAAATSRGSREPIADRDGNDTGHVVDLWGDDFHYEISSGECSIHPAVAEPYPL
jgi:hypothetical protein